MQISFISATKSIRLDQVLTVEVTEVQPPQNRGQQFQVRHFSFPLSCTPLVIPKLSRNSSLLPFRVFSTAFL